MDNGQLYDNLKSTLDSMNTKLDHIEARTWTLEMQVSNLMGHHEGFTKFKDIILAFYALIMTGITIYTLFFR